MAGDDHVAFGRVICQKLSPIGRKPMKYAQAWTGLACLLFTISSAFAQTTTRYIDPVQGKGDGTCTSTDPSGTNGPCTLARAFHSSNQTANTTFLVRVRRTGGTVTLAAPTTSLTKSITFGAYVAGSSSSVAGVLKFTGTLKMATTGQIALAPKAEAEFQNIILEKGGAEGRLISGAAFSVFKNENEVEKRVTIAGTLTVNPVSAKIDRLIVSKDMTIDGPHSLWLNALEVKSGAVLTLKTEPSDYDGGVMLFMKKGTSSTDMQGILRVDGKIVEGKASRTNPVWLAHQNKSGDDWRGDGSFFHASSDYDPSNGVDHADCLRVTGSGVIHAEIRTTSYGNLCVELKEVGNIHVAGSTVESGTQATALNKKNITTDLIFREDVVVKGDITQYNDSRVVFEKKATIEGDVILEDGTLPGLFISDTFGAARTASVRTGVQMGTSGDYTCAYATRRTDKKLRALHIPGVQFAGAATIEGELHVRSSTLTDGTPDATNAPACAPRVLFMAPVAKASGPTEVPLESSIGGDLAIENTENFGGKGRVYLDTDSLKEGTTVRKTTHILRVGGDLAAKGNTIGMAFPAVSNLDGMCMTKDPRLTFGNHLVLTDAAESVIVGDAANGLTLGTLVTFGDLRVEPGKGSLTVATLHVGPRAELTASRDVTVTESLLLQGELDGELNEASTVKKLTYGNRNTDVVKNAAVHADGLDALSIQIGNGELRMDEVHKTKYLGLCSGTLSLMDAESTTDSTLHVTEQITVQNGMLEKDTNDPGSLSTDRMANPNPSDRYVLTYITPGTRTVTDALEWFAPRDVIVNHASAEITTSGNRSIAGKLTVTAGNLRVDGELTVGTSSMDRTSAANVDKYSVLVSAGELHTEGQDMRVHGKVTVNGTSKLVTGGGDLHVLGRVQQGQYTSGTAQVSIAKDAMMDLGDGTLMLGPEDTKERDSVKGDDRPDVLLTLTGSLTADRIKVPKGSKQTTIDASADSKMLGTVVFDGTMTPGTENEDGMLTLKTVDTAGKELVVDSLSAMRGSVQLEGTKVVINRDVTLKSATIWSHSETTEFKKGLMLSGTGGLNADVNTDTKARSVLIHGDFRQRKGTTRGELAGVKLDSTTTKTVMGMYVVDSDTVRYVAEAGSKLILHGDFQFAKAGPLHAMVEFTGENAQKVVTGAKTALHSVTVNNAKGLLLESDVMQHRMATLTLRQGKIHSMPEDSMFTWTVRNVQVEQELRGRLSAQEGTACGLDQDETCQASILRGSRQSYAAIPMVRHLLQGTAGTGSESGGYLFPVGLQEGEMSWYRPLILQLPSDLNDTTAVTVTPVMVPDGVIPAWPAGNFMVPTTGGSLTLDVHADLFWKVELDEELPTNANIRVVAPGLQNVADVKGLRIVQWDCSWKNPKLAGRYRLQTDANSFAVNGYINSVVNLTQEGIGLGSCAILGIAANGIENPINQADLSGGRAMIQFIHNLPGSGVVDLHLGGVRISSGLSFRKATAYHPVGAGSLELTIRPAEPSEAEQAVTYILSLAYGKNYAVILHGSLTDPRLKVLDMRTESSVASKAEVRVVHGSADLGAAQVQVMDLTDPTIPVATLANNLMPDEATRRYVALNPTVQVIRVKFPDQQVEEVYEMDLYGYAGQTLVFNLSGVRNDLTILGIDKNGEVIQTLVVTGVEESAELPTEFALYGNYPNPFNPSTKIQFDLPERAQVQVQVVDLLGREVMVSPVQEMEAGTNRSLELNATSLASGTYLYRLIATGAEQRHVRTGRMMLVK